MELLKWTKALSVEIPEIDDQHKNFIAIINKAYTKSKKSKPEEIENILKELTEYARIHFSTEDNYFDNWDYPYKNEHDIEHEKLILKVLKFDEKFEKEGVKIIEDLIIFLKDWLENHLKNHDFKYRDYFKKEGRI